MVADFGPAQYIGCPSRVATVFSVGMLAASSRGLTFLGFVEVVVGVVDTAGFEEPFPRTSSQTTNATASASATTAPTRRDRSRLGAGAGGFDSGRTFSP